MPLLGSEKAATYRALPFDVLAHDNDFIRNRLRWNAFR